MKVNIPFNNKIKALCLTAATVVAACLSTGCQNRTIMNRTAPIAACWDYNEPVCFEFGIDDTASVYNVTFSVKHTEDFAWMNAFFFITTVFPDMDTKTDTLECLLADASGRWYGNRFGKYHSMDILFKQGIRFPAAGQYRFEIRHGMREDRLENMSAIGMKVQKETR